MHHWSAPARGGDSLGDVKSSEADHFPHGTDDDHPPVMKHLGLVVALAGSLLSTVVVASPRKQLALPVGHTMTMAMPSQVTSVRVTDPSLVEVKRQGRKVTLVALAKGSTEATVMTTEGPTTFSVYVAVDKYALPQ
jgi:Flp pilus assembly secretin CpaC